MKEYQRTRNNPYRLPHNLYMCVLYHIRDYDRLQAERREILLASPDNDGQPHGGTAHSVTESKALRLLKLDEACDAVERALQMIPPEYRKGVLNNICYGARYPLDAGAETYGRWRRRMLYWTAKYMGLL